MKSESTMPQREPRGARGRTRAGPVSCGARTASRDRAGHREVAAGEATELAQDLLGHAGDCISPAGEKVEWIPAMDPVRFERRTKKEAPKGCIVYLVAVPAVAFFLWVVLIMVVQTALHAFGVPDPTINGINACLLPLVLAATI